MTRILAASLTALLLAGCTISPDGPETDYRRKYPVQVHAETAVMTGRLTDDAGMLIAEDEFRLSRLVAGYLERGHGPMFVSATAPHHAEAMRLRLMGAGVPYSSIAMMPAERGSADTVTLRYDRFNVSVPACGDWSTDPSINHSNDVHSNFGCTLQRNFGLMVADPADLVRMRDAQSIDAQNANRVLQKYRTGLSPASIPSELHKERATGSIVAK